MVDFVSSSMLLSDMFGGYFYFLMLSDKGGEVVSDFLTLSD